MIDRLLDTPHTHLCTYCGQERECYGHKAWPNDPEDEDWDCSDRRELPCNKCMVEMAEKTIGMNSGLLTEEQSRKFVKRVIDGSVLVPEELDMKSFGHGRNRWKLIREFWEKAKKLMSNR